MLSSALFYLAPPPPPITISPAYSPAKGVQTHPGQAVLAGDFTKMDDGLG